MRAAEPVTWSKRGRPSVDENDDDWLARRHGGTDELELTPRNVERAAVEHLSARFGSVAEHEYNLVGV